MSNVVFIHKPEKLMVRYLQLLRSARDRSDVLNRREDAMKVTFQSARDFILYEGDEVSDTKPSESELEEIKGIIGQAMGYASLCWMPKPTGEFDSTTCAKGLDEAVGKVTERLTRAVFERVRPDREFQNAMASVLRDSRKRTEERIIELEAENEKLRSALEGIDNVCGPCGEIARAALERK